MDYRISDRLSALPFSEIRSVMERATLLERSGEKVIHLELGRPDFDTPACIKESCKTSLDKGHVFYTSNYGLPALRKAIAEKLNKENNIPYEPNEVLVTVGLSEAIYCALGSILNPGDEVLIPNPVWLNYLHVTRHFGGIPVSYHLKEENHFGIDIDEVASKITPQTRVIVIVSPHNPTGGMLNQNDLENLASLAIKHNLIVLSDEVYEKLVYDGLRHTSIASIPDMKERTITLNGFSKTFSMTGWRLGYMAAPSELIQACVRMHQYITTCATSFVQEAAIVALENRNNAVEEMVVEYKRRRDFIVKALNEIKGLSCLRPKGAFYVFVNIKSLQLSSAQLANRLLEEEKIALVPGSAFGESGEGYLRLSYATSYENLVTASERLDRFFRKI